MARCWICHSEGVAKGDICGKPPCPTSEMDGNEPLRVSVSELRKIRRQIRNVRGGRQRRRAVLSLLRNSLARRQSNRCALCGKPFTDSNPPTIDHRTPRTRGGSDDRRNLQATHKRCNQAKGNRTMEEWVARKIIGRFRPAEPPESDDQGR